MTGVDMGKIMGKLGMGGGTTISAPTTRQPKFTDITPKDDSKPARRKKPDSELPRRKKSVTALDDTKLG